MHKIDKNVLSSKSYYNGSGSIDNKVTQIKLAKPEESGHSLKHFGLNMLHDAVGMNHTLTLKITDAFEISDGNKVIKEIPFDQINFVQFGVLRLMSVASALPATAYALLIYIEDKNGVKYGLTDKNLKDYVKYLDLFNEIDLDVEDPFDIKHMDFSNNEKTYDYLNKNYERIAETVGY